MDKNTCNLCKLEKPLIRAHIVPKWVSREIDKKFGRKGSPKVLVSRDEPTKSVPCHGYFDEEILCKECDGKIGRWESYLKQFLEKRKSYDYTQVKLAILSILWKMHLSSQTAFKEIDLGPYAGQFYQLILASNAGEETAFPIWGFFYTNYANENNRPSICIDAQEWIMCKVEQCIFYKLFFYGHVFWIKISKKNLSMKLEKYMKKDKSNFSPKQYDSSSLKNSRKSLFDFYLQ